jgi:hypothetical protein
MHGFQSGLSDIVVQVLRALFSCPIKYHSIASTSKYYLPNDSWRLEWCDYSMQRSPWRSSLITLTSVIDRFLENLPFHHRSTLSELSTFISLGCLLLTPYWSAIFPLDYLPFLLPSSVNFTFITWKVDGPMAFSNCLTKTKILWSVWFKSSQNKFCW